MEGEHDPGLWGPRSITVGALPKLWGASSWVGGVVGGPGMASCRLYAAVNGQSISWYVQSDH